MERATEHTTEHHWFSIGGQPAPDVAKRIQNAVRNDISAGVMPADEEARVAAFSTSLSHGTFSASPERINLLRSLCQLYGRGVQAQTIKSHRRVIGPFIVAVKKIMQRLLLALLGPSFAFQREFNAHVIRLLADLSNEAQLPKGPERRSGSLES